MTDFGTDLACVTDLDPNMRTVTGVRCLAECLVRRITTYLGGVIDAPDDGIDIREYLSADVTSNDLVVLKAEIEGELLKDERVVSARTEIELSGASTDLVATITVAVQASDETSFPLVIAIKDVDIELLYPE